jgi:two-component system CheB/CheR fusion protein
MPDNSDQQSLAPFKGFDSAATDAPGENSRDGARKRRDPNEPAAVVGLGASAGGVTPLQQFFGDMKSDTGLAFVVVMHLSPEFESQLATIIQRKTSMPVTQVTEPLKVRPNHVYVIPPNRQLTFTDSMLDIVPPQQPQGRRVTIDLFFRSLAQAYGQRAVCVIMSGTDSDGVIGLKHIRAQGGLTIVQDPNEAEFDSMPASAISTGMVDWVLPVAEMPDKLLEFVTNENRMVLPPEIPEADDPEAKEKEAPGGETVAEVTRSAADEEAIGKVLADVRAQTGHDFSHYKRATVLRRIARRMQVNSIESIPRYLDFIRTHAAEGRALLQDLLIGVTHFFRDRDAFASLEAHIPQLFAGKKAEDEVRVWVVGCATGEEAYSIAMLLCEHCKRLENPPKVQIFATDIDEEAVAEARDALYPSMIEADVSPERLREFFQKDHGRYRVRKEIREKVLVAVQNILKDAPFSRCDLISCRNLLIYLRPEAQGTVFDVFHFALRSGGLLFLGGAENHSVAQSLFSPLDTKHRVFVHRSTPRPIWRVPALPMHQPRVETRLAVSLRNRPLPPLTHDVADEAAGVGQVALQARYTRREVLFGELHLRLLEQYGPPSVVVNQLHEIVHLSEGAGRYLQFVAGEPTANITKVVNPALAIEVRTALFKAGQTKATALGAPTAVEVQGETELITIEVRPMTEKDQAEGFFLVLFRKQETEGEVQSPVVTAHDAIARSADEEIQYLKKQLAATVEQYEAANEELKASNEQLQAMNEEMRSSAEELETSKEELQSVNEELITVNYELKANVEELSKTNADLNNLMASTDIGTVFLDRQLRIHRFTPSAQKIFNLIPADIGRPISDITSRLHFDGFIPECEKVLESLQTIEREVLVGGDGDAQWYMIRMAPYRTSEDRIAGVVATFINIHARRSAEEALRESESRVRRAMEIETVGIIFFTLDGRITDANDAFLKMSGYTHDDLKDGRVRWDKMTPPEWMSLTREQIDRVSRTGKIGPYEKQYIRKDGTRWWGLFTGTKLGEDFGVEYVLDVSDKKEAEEALRLSEERFRQFAENSADVFWILNAKTQQLEYINPIYEKMFGQSREKIMLNRTHRLDVVHPEDRKKAATGLPQALAGETFTRNYRIVRPSDGEQRWIRDTGFPIRNEAGEVVRIAGVAQDVTDEKEHSELLRESEEKLRLLINGAPEYAMFLMDPGNHIIYWSRGAERVFGWTEDEALGQTGEMIFTPEDRANEVEKKELAIARRNGSAPDRRWHLCKDGSRIWVDGIMHRLDDEKGELRGYAKIARNATEQRRAQEVLQQAHEELEERVRERTLELTAINERLQNEMEQRGRLEQEILLISEREKRRIGQDLHDSLCQELAATAFILETQAQKMAKKNSAQAQIFSKAARTVNANVGLARDLARGLHPIELNTTGLQNALREMAFRTEHSGKISCRFVCPRPVRIRDDAIALNLYRIAQEAVNNTLKHAKATEIVLTLVRKRSTVCLEIRDNGDGLSKNRSGKGMGVDIMQHRANVIGAKLTIESRQGRGTSVTCVLPGK